MGCSNCSDLMSPFPHSLYWVNSTVNKNTFHQKCLAKNGKVLYLDGIQTKKLPKYNLRSKWTSMCLSVDLAGNKWNLFVHGKELEHSKTMRPLNGKMSDATDLPMVVRLAHYYFDNKPIIGQIVDFNMWDR